ncbi:bacterial translation initiation factor 2 (bIF-2) [Prochlorococcus marinus str. NATL2A]|uniref:Translation initiation factor IF-2 n=1 Tax=Prochlorococcus marinus (strain NATL2A) TaxID=59920 RepID=IF2_PROMT|nr:translation initiation factor IF-2 [Prochlorococcus marinus]Q46J13.1 RecName: Full=Translation initiation factor IF-2 [Prochlorococcus marinus str. NATL2A]AAZ58515.1 bacterial translation initiation factor 2 (bIF-2) [Prochlorococcus marinus str. NATL2A]
MTSSGKIRIYELSKDLSLDNKDVLDAARKLAIAAKSHSSSISSLEANQIKDFLKKSNTINTTIKSSKNLDKQILSVKKNPVKTQKDQKTEPKKKNHDQTELSQAKLNTLLKPSQTLIKSQGSSQANNQKALKNKFPAKQQITSPSKPNKPLPPNPRVEVKPIISKPLTQAERAIPQSEQKKDGQFINQPKRSELAKKSIGQPKQINPQEPKRPLAPPSRPKIDIQDKKPLQPNNQKAKTRINQGEISPQKVGQGNIQKIKSQNKQNAPSRTPQPPTKGNTLELVGAPIRKEKPVNKPHTNEVRNKPVMPSRPGAPKPPTAANRQGLSNRPGSNNRIGGTGRPGSPNRQGPNRGGVANRTTQGQNRPGANNRAGAPVRSGSPNRGGMQNRPGVPTRSLGGPNRSNNRPGVPSGMRKPVAPSELMQLQKPQARPNAPQRKTDSPTSLRPKRENSTGARPPVNRPTPAAPKKPAHRPGGTAAAPRRTGRPDWDDSAKLDALRNKSPQKQRQKVHIIGENDDALTAERGGFAGEQQAVVLSASLARPSKPKVGKRNNGKPLTALKKRKKETTRQRQRRRAMELRASREAKLVRPEMIVVPEDNLTVQELADMLSVESSEIIKSLFFKGITATVTQSLDLATIETVAEEFGVPVLQDDVEEAAKKTVEMIEEGDLKYLIRRPPVVTVMGHVDHGKTSLLDAIRKARVAAGEAGGITQHIGAYQIETEHDGSTKKLTFLDTPGHEAFTAMRARGTRVTDVAILVVAADDGVRPQTLEAISHARAAKVPIVVAINKIDKEGSSPDRVKQELSEQDLLSEEWGGDVVMVPVSAIKGENIDKLLEMVLLVTEVEDLQANPDRLAKGTVIEAHLDKAKGPVATLLVQNGTLKSGDVVAAGPVLGKVRAMVDENGSRIKEAGPSCPVEALGFSEVPTAGDEFEVYPDEKAARAVVGERATDARAARLAQQMASRRVSLSSMSGQASEGELKELNIILKADVQGSLEAILGSLEQLPKDEVQVRVLLSAPGEITETDIDLAAASGAVIVGFNTSMASGAKRAADANGVDVREYEVIYKLLEDIQLAMEGLLEPEMIEEALGVAEVRAIFSIGKSAVAGCYVTNGKIQRNCRARVKRGKQIVFEGDLDSLKRNKDDVKDVSTGFECGIGCDRFANWEEGDQIEAFKLVTQRRKLNN